MGRNGVTGRKFSRFESVAAHVWQSICNARGLVPDQLTTRLHMPINGRTRLHPPLLAGFFGNAILRVTLEAPSGDLVTPMWAIRMAELEKGWRRWRMDI